jgi:hypothetical protein
MIIPAAWLQGLNFFGMRLVVEPSAGQLSGDAGLLPMRQFDRRMGMTPAYAEAVDGPAPPASPSTASPRGPARKLLPSSLAARAGTVRAVTPQSPPTGAIWPVRRSGRSQ